MRFISCRSTPRLRASAVIPFLVAGCGGGGPAVHAPAPASAPAISYRAVVANESSDHVSIVEFTPPDRLALVDSVSVGSMPMDLDGPHGVVAAPDGSAWYVSLAHGTPHGKVWKHDARTGELLGQVVLGSFPASMALSADGSFLYVVNFDLHGDPVPSSVSIVYTGSMTEVARPTTCVMPHGSRIDAATGRQYSACMHSDQLVEIDPARFAVSRRFSVAPGKEGPLPIDDVGAHAMHSAGATVCSPTWAQPGKGPRAGRFVYVPCNRAARILEVDLASGAVSRRFETGRTPYNLDVTPDGRLLVATLKGAQAVEVIDLDAGRTLATMPTSRPVTHGVTITPDGRWALVTNEAVGRTRGTVDAIDLVELRRVASVEVGLQAGGIDLLPP